MGRLFHDSIYRFDAPVPSYWEATAPDIADRFQAFAGEETCEVAVIGGGFTGLSTALHLARDHGSEVRLLEAGKIAWGASGRNGGFCCLAASKLGLTQMIERYGLDETKRFYAAQLEGMDLNRQLCADEAIDCDLVGDGNLEVAHRPKAFAGLKEEARALQRYFGIPTTVYDRVAFPAVGHQSNEQFGGLHVGAGYGLHPLKFAQGLALAAARHGANLHPFSEVLDWTREPGGWHRLVTKGGTVKARRVVVAANGFMPEKLHPAFDRRILPALSNIITTRPLTEAEVAAQSWNTLNPVCNTRTLLFYYRLLPDRTFLFGARGDFSGSPAAGQQMKAWMTRRLGEVFPAWREVEISHFWRGLVCLTRRRTPAIGRLEDDPSVLFGYGYHANGVNTAPWAGRELARLALGNESPQARLPAVLAGAPPRFPFAALRLWALRAAFAWYKVRDDWI